MSRSTPSERITAAGEVLIELDEEQARFELERLRRCNVEGVAICLLNAYVDGRHELRLRELAQEIFGPELSIIPFREEDDAVLQANDTTYGLSAAVWTRDVARAHKVMRALKAGRLWINTFGESDPAMAFGGYKQSGVGRESGAAGLEEFFETKSLAIPVG